MIRVQRHDYFKMTLSSVATVHVKSISTLYYSCP